MNWKDYCIEKTKDLKSGAQTMTDEWLMEGREKALQDFRNGSIILEIENAIKAFNEFESEIISRINKRRTF